MSKLRKICILLCIAVLIGNAPQSVRAFSLHDVWDSSILHPVVQNASILHNTSSSLASPTSLAKSRPELTAEAGIASSVAWAEAGLATLTSPVSSLFSSFGNEVSSLFHPLFSSNRQQPVVIQHIVSQTPLPHILQQLQPINQITKRIVEEKVITNVITHETETTKIQDTSASIASDLLSIQGDIAALKNQVNTLNPYQGYVTVDHIYRDNSPSSPTPLSPDPNIYLHTLSSGAVALTATQAVYIQGGAVQIQAVPPVGQAGIVQILNNTSVQGNLTVQNSDKTSSTVISPTGITLGNGTPFTLDSSGNLAVGGTLAVTGATTLSSTLAVTGATTLTSLTTTGNVTFSGGSNTFSIPDNTASAFLVKEGANKYINIDTTNAAENISLGNATTNPTYSFLGTGTTTLGGNLTVTGTAWTATPTISGLITATSGLTSNGTLTVSANQNLTLASGTGQFSQTYSNSSAGAAVNASLYNITNSYAGITVSTIVNGLDITLANATNTNNVDTTNGIMFEAATNNNSNIINGINFASATGYTNFLKSPSIVIDKSGNISGAGTIGSGAITSTGGISGTQLTSTIATGTAPLVVTSTTNVANLNASSLNGATFASPGAIGSTTPSTGAFTTLTSSGNSTIGTGPSLTNTFGSGSSDTNTIGGGASSINTIGSTTTPGALTLHGATTLDNTFTVSGSNLTSLGGNLTVTGTAWTATPTISGLITATSGLTSNGTLTVSANQNFTMASGTGVHSQTFSGTTQTPFTLTSTFSPTAGGTQNNINTSITNTAATSANTLRGLNLAITDNSTALANTDIGLNVDVSAGTNASATRYAALFNGGNVGIGTAAPIRAFEVLGTSGSAYAEFRNPTSGTTGGTNGSFGGLLLERQSNTAGAGNGIGFDFGNSSSTTADVEYGYIGAFLNTNTASAQSGSLAFYTTNAGTTRKERVRIDTGGNVGIGTTAPGALLDLGLAGTTLGVVRLAGNTSGNVTINPAAAAGTWTLTLPTSAGSASQFLQTDGNGVTTWATVNTSSALSSLTAATATNTIANANFAQTWNWGTLTTQTGMTFGGGTAMTTGSLFSLGSSTYVHTALNDVGSLASLSFTDASTNVNNGGVTNGLLISPTLNTTGAGTKTINGLNIAAPTDTACTTGACTYNGLKVTGGSIANITSTALTVDAGSGAGTNYAAAFLNGNVGIGTATPNNTIQVASLIDFDNTHFITALGYQAGNMGNTGGAVLTSTAVGYQALKSNTTGSNDIAVGYQALFSDTTGAQNSALGLQALQGNTTGSENSALGYQALDSNTTSSFSSAFGSGSLVLSTGAQNSAFGYRSLFVDSTGANNTAVGFEAGYVGTGITTGSSDSFFGYQAQASSATLTNATAIGANASVGCSNCLVLGSGVNVGAGTSSPNAKLDALATSGDLIRASYDTSNYAAFTESSTGATTLTLNGQGEALTIASGTTLTSVATTPGTAAPTALTITGATGGNTSIATTGVGGIGGLLTLTGGIGGTADSAVTADTGGKGGNLTFTTGVGGAAAATAGVKTGGAGGDFLLSGGIGGATSGAGTSNTGGAGGSLYLFGGTGGTASGATSNTAGASGNVLLAVNSGGTAIGKVGVGTTGPNGLLDISEALSGAGTLVGPYLSISTSTYTASSNADMAFNSLAAPTLAASGVQTTTNGYTFYIAGAPAQGANETITNSYALGVNGNTKIIGALTLTTALTVANGGTGLATLTAHGVLIGEGTSNVAITSAGSSGQVLTSNGAAADPTFQALPAPTLTIIGPTFATADTTMVNAATWYTGVTLGSALTNGKVYLISGQVNVGDTNASGGLISCELFDSTNSVEITVANDSNTAGSNANRGFLSFPAIKYSGFAGTPTIVLRCQDPNGASAGTIFSSANAGAIHITTWIQAIQAN